MVREGHREGKVTRDEHSRQKMQAVLHVMRRGEACHVELASFGRRSSGRDYATLSLSLQALPHRRRHQVRTLSCRLSSLSTTIPHHHRHGPTLPPSAASPFPYTLYSACAQAPRRSHRGRSKRTRRLDPLDSHLPSSCHLGGPLPHWHGVWLIT